MTHKALSEVDLLQLSIEYYLPHVTAKALVGLTASPTINASLSTGWNDLTLGTNFTVDTAKNNSLTNWTAGVGEPLCKDWEV